MATLIYRGYAVAVRAEIRITPANVEVGDIFTIVFGSKTVTFTATAATVANVTAGLLAAITAADYPEFDECNWSDQTTYLKALGPTSGKPIGTGITCSATNGGAANTQTLTKTTTTAGTGPEDWSNGENWIGGTVPGSSDRVVIGLYPYAPKYGLPTASTFTHIELARSPYSGLYVGLLPVNENGYIEYLPLGVVCTLTTAFECGTGDGPFVPGGNFNITGNIPYRIYGTERRGTNGVAPLQLSKGNSNSATLISPCNGSVDFGNRIHSFGFATPDFTGYTANVGRNGDIRIAPESRCDYINVVSGGFVFSESTTTHIAVTLRDQSRMIVSGLSGGITTLVMEPNTLFDLRSPCTIAACNSAGVIELSNDPRPSKQFTSLDLFAGALLNDPLKVGVYVAGIDCNYCTPGVNVTLNLGTDIRVTRGTPA